MKTSASLLGALGATLISSGPLLAYDTEYVSYGVPGFQQTGQYFPAEFLTDYPNRDTAIPQPTQKLLNHADYQNVPNELTLFAKIALPENIQTPRPVVVVVHGSGGLWPNGVNTVGGDMALQFESWADELTDRGYIAVFPDSFNPRGIEEGFEGRRPHVQAQFDNVDCAATWDRPRDILATLDYLATRVDVDTSKVSIVAFSHGAETVYNSFNDPSVNRADTDYVVSRYDYNGQDHVAQTHNYESPSPCYVPDDHPAFPQFIALYYPGCHSYGYNGRLGSQNEDEYYPNKLAEFALFHGDDDDLYDSGENNSKYDAFSNRIALHAQAYPMLNLDPQPFTHKEVFSGAEHSFDYLGLTQNPSAANLAAFEAAREIVYGRLTYVDLGPQVKPGLIFGSGGIKAPGLLFEATPKLDYTIYRMTSTGGQEMVAQITGYEGPAAVPFVNANDQVTDYRVEMVFAETPEAHRTTEKLRSSGSTGNGGNLTLD